MSGSQPSSSDILPPATLLQHLQINVDISQECRDLVATLPKEKRWPVEFYQYQGFWFDLFSLQGTLNFQKHFQAHDTDIILATTPKSGTTWLKALIYALINRSSIFLSQQLNLEKVHHPLVTKNPHDLVPHLELHLFLDNQAHDLSSLPAPRIFSTHLAFTSLPSSVRESGCKVVYLCREPKDTFISYWHFMNKQSPPEFGIVSVEDAFDDFCRGVSLFGPFWDHVLGYWKGSSSLDRPEKFMFLQYEEMKQEPALHLRKLAEFLGCPFSVEEEKDEMVERILHICSFDNLSNLEVNRTGNLSSGHENKLFFRKGETGDWKNYLTREMAQRINQITEEMFCGSGLTF